VLPRQVRDAEQPDEPLKRTGTRTSFTMSMSASRSTRTAVGCSATPAVGSFAAVRSVAQRGVCFSLRRSLGRTNPVGPGRNPVDDSHPAMRTPGLLTRLNDRSYSRFEITLHWFVEQSLRTNAFSGVRPRAS
jgi:hypothetical protein